MTGAGLTYKETVRIVLEFLQVAINYILYIRNIYPSTIFKDTKIYNIPAKQSTYPALNDYISLILTTIKPDLDRQRLTRLFVCLEQDDRVVEKYTFQILNMVEDINSVSLAKLESYLRNYVLKLTCLDASLKPISPGLSWNCYLEMKEGDCQPTGSSGLFISATEEKLTVPDGKIYPIKTVDTGLLKLEMFVEQSTV